MNASYLGGRMEAVGECFKIVEVEREKASESGNMAAWAALGEVRKQILDLTGEIRRSFMFLKLKEGAKI